MKILGIETSCDETGAAVIEATSKDKMVKLISNSLATSLESHIVTGGIIPEIAAREQIKYILSVVKEALSKANLNEDKPDIDAIAVTYGPGLIGSLLVGVETAKTLSYLWDIPIIPVNHMYGHIYANWIAEDSTEHRAEGKEKLPHALSVNPLAIVEFPAIALVVSGGHTDLVLIRSHGDLEVIGGTRDDAAGEAFDKIGRLLGLDYPAGPVISRLAEKGDLSAFRFPRPMWDSKDYDFSFSGLKTSVLNLIKKNNWNFTDSYRHPELDSGSHGIPDQVRNDMFPEAKKQLMSDLCASVQAAIVDVLVFKTLKAVNEYKVDSLLLGGGVAANKKLTDSLKSEIKDRKLEINLFIPSPNLCTDNAAMIAAAGFYNDEKTSWNEVSVDPELYY